MIKEIFERILIEKACQDNPFIAQSLEHFFKLFLLLIDAHINNYHKKLQEEILEEKSTLLAQISDLKSKINDLTTVIEKEKQVFEIEYQSLKQKIKSEGEVIFVLKQDLDELNRKIADCKDFDNADHNLGTLMRSLNSFNGFLEKLDEENVLFASLSTFKI